MDEGQIGKIVKKPEVSTEQMKLLAELGRIVRELNLPEDNQSYARQFIGVGTLNHLFTQLGIEYTLEE